MKFVFAILITSCFAISALAIDMNAVPTNLDAAKAKMGQSGGSGSMSSKINVNTASEADLQKIPGIGPEKAKAIVAGRPYNSLKDLTKVPGIKEATLAKMKAFVTTK